MAGSRTASYISPGADLPVLCLAVPRFLARGEFRYADSLFRKFLVCGFESRISPRHPVVSMTNEMTTRPYISGCSVGRHSYFRRCVCTHRRKSARSPPSGCGSMSVSVDGILPAVSVVLMGCGLAPFLPEGQQAGQLACRPCIQAGKRFLSGNVCHPESLRCEAECA